VPYLLLLRASGHGLSPDSMDLNAKVSSLKVVCREWEQDHMEVP
jgi:hypothetical protein